MMLRLKVTFLALCAAWLAASCSDPAGPPSAGSNSNWLRGCASDVECGDALACLCNVCTRLCDSSAECAELPGGVCAASNDGSLRSQCGAEAPEAGVCLEQCTAGSCGAGRACVAGACITAVLPADPFCAEVAGGGAEESRAEDELLQALQERRLAGGVACAGGAVSAPALALALDSRLTCAARVLARDLAENGTSSLIDSMGRNTSQRAAAAGYVSVSSFESFVTIPGTVREALATLLEVSTACQGLVSREFTDVGVGTVGDARVVIVANQ